MAPRLGATIDERRGVDYHSMSAASLLNRVSDRPLPFGWTVNPYRGCEMACRYCFARYTHEFLGFTDSRDFERTIYVKRTDAATIVADLRPGAPQRAAGGHGHGDRSEFPELVAAYRRLYAGSAYARADYTSAIMALVARLAGEVGLAQRQRVDWPLTPRARQLALVFRGLDDGSPRSTAARGRPG